MNRTIRFLSIAGVSCLIAGPALAQSPSPTVVPQSPSESRPGASTDPSVPSTRSNVQSPRERDYSPGKRANQNVQSPRENQDVQSPRANQNVQAPRENQDLQSPREPLIDLPARHLTLRRYSQSHRLWVQKTPEHVRWHPPNVLVVSVAQGLRFVQPSVQ